MLDESEKERWTRRGFLGASSAALAAGMLAANHTAGQSQDPARKAKSERSRSEPVPKNPALDEENLDSVNPPPTDAGGVQTFKYPFSIAHKRLHEGGWSRTVTSREHPPSCKPSSMPSPSRTSACMEADGPASSPCANL